MSSRTKLVSLQVPYEKKASHNMGRSSRLLDRDFASRRLSK